MASARVQVRSSGVLSVQPSPLEDASQTLVDLALSSDYQSGTWTRSSMHDTVSGASYVTLVDPPASAVAKVFALRLKTGPAIKVRVTYENSGAQVCPVGSCLFLTPPEDDRLTLIEVSGDAAEDSTIAWCAIV
jgi:hypothetical protein